MRYKLNSGGCWALHRRSSLMPLPAAKGGLVPGPSPMGAQGDSRATASGECRLLRGRGSRRSPRSAGEKSKRPEGPRSRALERQRVEPRTLERARSDGAPSALYAPRSDAPRVDGANLHGLLIACSNRVRYCSRGMATAPNCWVMGVSIWISKRA